jgi:ADP-ribose pyrophosphatase
VPDISNWKKISETSQKIGWRWITTKKFTDPAGVEQEYTTISRPGSQFIAVVALTKTGKVVIAKQYRPGPEAVFYELPGGIVDKDEDIAKAALRELSEETGYTSDDELYYLGKACRDAYTNDINHYFLAANCYKYREAHPDDGEFVEVEEITVKELLDNARSFKMSDSVAVLLAYDQLEALSERS